jgi:hypothetical protein
MFYHEQAPTSRGFGQSAVAAKNSGKLEIPARAVTQANRIQINFFRARISAP